MGIYTAEGNSVNSRHSVDLRNGAALDLSKLTFTPPLSSHVDLKNHFFPDECRKVLDHQRRVDPRLQNEIVAKEAENGPPPTIVQQTGEIAGKIVKGGVGVAFNGAALVLPTVLKRAA